MKPTRMTIATDPCPHVQFHRDLPGLFWGELVELVDEWAKFEQGKKGTRFDKWLRPKPAAGPR
jgi:hypothetical protein